MTTTKMSKQRSDSEVEKINRIQSDFFGGLTHVFEPPLPEGVPDRLGQIVMAADIKKGDSVLDVGSGTGILVPIIQSYRPKRIVACDLCKQMLDHIVKNYPSVETILGDVRDMSEPDEAFNVIFVNACYPNIADKEKSITNMARMMKKGGRLVISHPMGKLFVEKLRPRSPFPLDSFPEYSEAELLLTPVGLDIISFEDKVDIYLLVVKKV